MSVFQKQASKKIDTVFVFALFTLFAIVSFTLILIGTKEYQYVTKTMNQNYLDRTISSYLGEKIRQNDVQDAIVVSDLMGTPALSILTTEGAYSYITHIYYYEEALRELVVNEHSQFSLSSGQPILELQYFKPEFTKENLIRIDITNANGKEQTFFYTLHSATVKEAA